MQNSHSTVMLEMRPGLPSNGDQHVFLLHDGSLAEGVITRDANGTPMLVTYNLAGAPDHPQKIVQRAAERVVAHAPIRAMPLRVPQPQPKAAHTESDVFINDTLVPKSSA